MESLMRPTTSSFGRRTAIITSLALFAMSARLAAQEFAPYEARIIAPSAAVRSGPEQKFYPTDTLPLGEIVHVFRHADGGWCAIRPPDGSFSWIFGRHLKMLDDAQPPGDDASVRLAEIDKPGVASRIGSRLSQQRNAVQIRLKQGEIVQVLGEETTGGETWYMVAPPAGEFRWIHATAIRRVGDSTPSANAPVRVAAEAIVQAGSTDASTAGEASPIATDLPSVAPNTSRADAAAPTAASGDAAATPNNHESWQASPETGPAAPPTDTSRANLPQSASSGSIPIEPIPLTKPSADSAAAAQPPQQSPSESPPLAPQQSPPLPADSPGRFTRPLADLEIRLSRIVSEPPVAWHLEPLAQETSELLAQVQTPAQRQAIQATAAKVERFAAIARQHRGLAGGPITPIVASPASPMSGGAGWYDAEGILRPVVTQRPGAPPFALVDDRGQVVTFVTPAPGFDLRPFIGQRIGVAGNRGYIPEFQRNHVLAGRAAPLDGRTLR
jgi:hypothetical protein